MSSGTNIKLYKNDVLIYDCTLCQAPDGRVGWWNAVDGTFHEHKPSAPVVATQLEYVEDIGTQYIDTGVEWKEADNR